MANTRSMDNSNRGIDSVNGKIIKGLWIEDPGDKDRQIEKAVHESAACGCEWVRTPHLEEALQHLRNSSFDVILFEFPAPHPGDLKLLEKIKSVAVSIPVLAASDTKDESLIQEMLHQGAEDYLVRDWDLNGRMLSHILQNLLWRKKASSEPSTNGELSGVALQVSGCHLWDWNLRSNRVHYSPGWSQMLGLQEADLKNRSEDWLSRIHPEDRYTFQKALEDHLKGQSPSLKVEQRILHRDGSYRWVLVQGIAMQSGGDKPERMVGTHMDITQRKRNEEKVQQNAFYDQLTGLPSRSLFMNRLDQDFRRFKRHPKHTFAVLSLDLDRFKVVNDGLGHSFGDLLLINVARRLETCLREVDTIARVGGDEYLILLDPPVDSTGAIQVVERIVKVLNPSFDLNGKEIFTSASIGIAISSPNDENAEDLIRDAETAMYGAKSLGGGKYKIFDTQMYERAIARLNWENELRRAIDSQDFTLAYQPIVSLPSGKISGFEALIRWKHPERGIIMPLDFIPLAEETGLIIPIGRWVLRQACHQMREWQQRFALNPPLNISVNVSFKQLLHGDFVEDLAETLKETNIAPGSLCLELTESGIIQNSEIFLPLFSQLRALNVEFHIDDFGTGYSSLSYLYRFQFDKLKIDRSFLAQKSDTNKNPEILPSVISLAHNLKIPTIAEGVETPADLALLRELRCEYGQGYYFARPMPVHEVAGFIASNPQW